MNKPLFKVVDKKAKKKYNCSTWLECLQKVIDIQEQSNIRALVGIYDGNKYNFSRSQ